MGYTTTPRGMSYLKLLIDECLSHRLCGVARARGLEAMHLKDIGMPGITDWDIVRRIQSEDWPLVTNNGRDFIRLYSQLNLHAGLMVIVPNVNLRLLRQALYRLGPAPDMVNKLAFIALDGRITLEDWPR
jgi:predicted nuclease of predicted toxin-antitoxin system